VRTYCNPLNLEYRFSVKGLAKKCFREGADPSVVFFKGRYWLFPSKSGGCWHSEDLLKWTFVPAPMLPTEDYAPDVRVIKGTFFFTASKADKNCSIYKTDDPASGKWEKAAELFPYWDPNMFQDDDGRIYFYWGCSNGHPIYGLELDPDTMLPAKESSDLIFANPGHQGWPERFGLIWGKPDCHGWERFAENNSENKAPWIEGAGMNKFNNKYYLQ